MRIVILGMGSVGRGVLASIMEKDLPFTVTGIADSKSGIVDPSGIDPGKVMTIKREKGICGNPGITPIDVVRQADYDVLVEVTTTNATTGEPATSHIREAIMRGRHVVTSNKGPLALHFRELKALAREHDVSLRYEATVAGAIPVMHTIENGLAGNRINAIYGVLNGTCNYILTRMAEEGLSYEQALIEARELGYAEADPTYDVKGIDAAIKVVILANTIWNMNVGLSDVEVTGIDLLTTAAIRLAEEQDCTIRLLGEAVPNKNLLRVSPRILPRDHPLVLNGTLNALTLSTDLAGDITLIGKGAGSKETASAIIGDILFIKRMYAGRA